MIATIRLSYKDCAARCKVNGDAFAATVYIPAGKLERLYRSDPVTVGAVLSNYVRQAFGWPRGEANRTIIHFRAA
jgi:hypothetical protein